MNDSNNPSAIRSRKQITGALLSLMEKYPYEEISVKQIVLETDLVRKTFYRNFKSKDDVLRTHIRAILREYFDIVNNAKGDVLTTVFAFVTEIDRMLVYFSKVQDLYDEYDRYVEIQNAEQGDNEESFLVFLLKFVLAPFTHEYADLANGLIWLGLVISVFGVFILISEIFTYYKLIAIGCFLVSGLLCYIAVILFVENRKNKRQERKHMESVIANLKEYHENYGYCLVTFENANPKMLHRVRDYLVSGQAYTLDDALRLAYD